MAKGAPDQHELGGTGAGTRRPDGKAIALSISILLAGVVVALVLDAATVKPVMTISVPANQGFGLFAAFYVAAQIIERLTEPVTWLLDRWPLTDDTKKPNRTALIHSISVFIAVVISSALGLHFLQAVGIGNATDHLPSWIDSYATALVISGGTKPLHDFISFLQQNKDKVGSGAA
jgi:hypothetical protein